MEGVRFGFGLIIIEEDAICLNNEDLLTNIVLKIYL
jgi:hypothetical protein